MTAKIIGALHTEMALNRSKRLLKLTGRRRGGGGGEGEGVLQLRLNIPCCVYVGNLWFVWPIDCNVKHHIFQHINFPYTQHRMFKCS